MHTAQPPSPALRLPSLYELMARTVTSVVDAYVVFALTAISLAGLLLVVPAAVVVMPPVSNEWWWQTLLAMVCVANVFAGGYVYLRICNRSPRRAGAVVLLYGAAMAYALSGSGLRLNHCLFVGLATALLLAGVLGTHRVVQRHRRGLLRCLKKCPRVVRWGFSAIELLLVVALGQFVFCVLQHELIALCQGTPMLLLRS